LHLLLSDYTPVLVPLVKLKAVIDDISADYYISPSQLDSLNQIRLQHALFPPGSGVEVLNLALDHLLFDFFFHLFLYVLVLVVGVSGFVTWDLLQSLCFVRSLPSFGVLGRGVWLFGLWGLDHLALMLLLFK
jgi:hypothetical protein